MKKKPHILTLAAAITLAASTIPMLVPLAAQAQNSPARQGPSASPLSSRMPTAAEIDAARQALPSRDELERAVQEQQRNPGVRLPGQALDLSRQAGPDLSRLAEQYEQLRRGPAGAAGSNDREAAGLMIFVSLGLPKASLQRAVADASRVRGTLVLRGVRERSLAKTTAVLAELMQERQVSWQIDPALFKRFDVRAVPAVVLVDPAKPVLVDCGENRCQQASFAKVGGDVTLGYALATIEREEPALAGLARELSVALKRGPGKP